MVTITLKYFDNGDNFGRGLWLFLNAVIGGIFLVGMSYIFHVHLLAWWLFIIYVIIAGIWGGLYKNWLQFLGDWVTGSLGLCSLIFYVFLTLLFNL